MWMSTHFGMVEMHEDVQGIHVVEVHEDAQDGHMMETREGVNP